MAYAVLWLFLAVLGTTFCVGLVIGVIKGWEAAHGSSLSSKALIASAAGNLSFVAILLYASWRRSLVVGDGDRALGLANYPVKRLGVVTSLVIVQFASLASLLVAILMLPAMRRVVEGVSSPIGDNLTANPASAVATILVVVVGAPVAEELFFRGWLWTGLRRSWSVLPTAFVTGLLWLLMHLDGGLYRPLFLIPAAITFSLARHFGKSVRAPILVHAINNVAALMLVFLPITDK